MILRGPILWRICTEKSVGKNHKPEISKMENYCKIADIKICNGDFCEIVFLKNTDTRDTVMCNLESRGK